MRTARHALLASALFRIALAAPMPAAEPVWTSHGPTDIAWITDVAISDSTAYAATLNGVFRSGDSGATWRQSALPGEPIDQVLARSGESAVFARSTSHVLYVSRDGGQSWVSAGLPSVYTVALDSGHPSTVYAASADGRLAKSTDAGTSWQWPSRIPGDGIGIGFAFDSLAIYVLTMSGLYKSLDGGATWTSPPQPIRHRHGQERIALRRHCKRLLLPERRWSGDLDLLFVPDLHLLRHPDRRAPR